MAGDFVIGNHGLSVATTQFILTHETLAAHNGTDVGNVSIHCRVCPRPPESSSSSRPATARRRPVVRHRPCPSRPGLCELTTHTADTNDIPAGEFADPAVGTRTSRLRTAEAHGWPTSGTASVGRDLCLRGRGWRTGFGGRGAGAIWAMATAAGAGGATRPSPRSAPCPGPTGRGTYASQSISAHNCRQRAAW